MSPELIAFFSTIGWTGVGALFVWFVLKPLVKILGDKINGKNPLSDRVDKIETNDLDEIKRRLDILEQHDLRIEVRLNKFGEDISWLKGRQNK